MKSEWPIVVLSFDTGLLGGEAALISYAPLRTDKDPSFQSSYGAMARRVRAGCRGSYPHAMKPKATPR